MLERYLKLPAKDIKLESSDYESESLLETAAPSAQ